MVLSCPSCCFEGYDRWRRAFCTPRCCSQEGFEIIAKLMFPFTGCLCTASVLQRGANHPLWQRQTNTPTFRRGTCKYSDLAPCNSPRRTMQQVCIKTAAASIDIFQCRRAVPQCNLHPTHFLYSFQIITCCTQAVCICACLSTSPWVQKKKELLVHVWAHNAVSSHFFFFKRHAHAHAHTGGRWTFWVICNTAICSTF